MRRISLSFVLTATLAVMTLPLSLMAQTEDPSQHVTVRRTAAPEDKVLHALNRFTFGPRPGEEAAVRSIGLRKWFEQQLTPASINDSALSTRLAEFPALQLPTDELIRRYPNPNLIRRIARRDGGMPDIPDDPVEHAIYADQVAFAQIAFERRQQQNAAPNASAQNLQKSTEQEFEAGIERMPENEVQAFLSLAPDTRFQRILAMQPDSVIALRKGVGSARIVQLTAGMAPQQREVLLALAGTNRMLSDEILQARILRDVYSERQLEAVLTDFWLNHFNVFRGKNQQELELVPAFERDAIRKNALGNFEQLLVATALSPAMLMYLDNANSTGPHSLVADRSGRNPKRNVGLNENYARELMELHTLGVNGGYTQADVTEVAKVFTGWTIARRKADGSPAQDDDFGEFVFLPQRHEPGTKTVLGQPVHEDGVNEGLQVLHLLANSPATAHFISQKLAVRFVSDNPPPALVNAMAATFVRTHGDIKSVLRTLFSSPQFWSHDAYRAKLKTPLEYVVSAARASNAQITDALPMAATLDRLGMPLYGCSTPNGYHWDEASWLSSAALINRMNFALLLSTGHLQGTHVDWPTGTSNQAAKEQQLEVVLLGFAASAQTRNTVLTQNPHPEDPQAAVMAGLLLGSPEFQRR